MDVFIGKEYIIILVIITCCLFTLSTGAPRLFNFNWFYIIPQGTKRQYLIGQSTATYILVALM